MTGRHSPSMAAEDSTHWPKPWYRLTAGSSYAAHYEYHDPPQTSVELLAGLQRGNAINDVVVGGARCWLAAVGRNGQHLDFAHLRKAAAVRCPSHCDIAWFNNL